MAERYDRARRRVTTPFQHALAAMAERVSADARRGLNGLRVPEMLDGIGFRVPEEIDGMIEGRPVRVLIGATGGHLHVSISRTDARRGKVGRSLPSWEDVVSVRACCWPDTVEVVQVLPALDGDDGEDWLSVAEVLHLHGPLVEVSDG